MRNHLSALAAALICFVFQGCEEARPDGEVVFMDSIRVFEEFHLKKEMDARLDQDLSALLTSRDSISKAIKGNTSAQQVNALQEQLKTTEALYQQKAQSLSAEYTRKVYEDLNKLIAKFSRQQHYRMVLGSSGEGNVMYVDSTADITKELIRFINSEKP